MSMSKEELKSQVEKIIHRHLGSYESNKSLRSTAVDCIRRGYDLKKTTDKLHSYLESTKAKSLAEVLLKKFGLKKTEEKIVKKRHRDEEEEVEKTKKSRIEPATTTLSPGQLTTIQIQEMMANAQKVIEERKKQMLITGIQIQPVAPVEKKEDTSGEPSLSENKARIAQLTAMIQAKLSSKPALLSNWKPDDGKQQHKPAPLILDSEGRTLDMTGKEVHLTHHMPTLKANIRAQKRAQFKISSEKGLEELYDQNFFDPRVSAKTFQRTRKNFKFHDKGKFQQIAQRLRTKAQLEKLQDEIAQAAKKTGISSATKLALIVPRKEYKEGDVPDIEWWDSYILQSDTYDTYCAYTTLEGVTPLVEHPRQMKSPCETSQPVFIPLYLTKKERKKLRRQNRREAWKEQQEKIRLGLEPAPEPKVRMSNLMRVLGNQAVQDPTKVEAHVREQMAKRQKAHEEANAARKLTTEQKRDKKIRKLQEDTSTGVHVAVYRVLNLSSPAKKFKVEMNAKQLFMTGCVLLYRNINIVVVEGGPGQQKKFKRLMLQRIKWSEEQATRDGTDQSGKIENKCMLIWEGTVTQRSFGEIMFKLCANESIARDFFKKRGVEHYWDLVYGTSVLEAAEE